jgi:hypothetical protein
VATGPGDQTAAAQGDYGYGRLRASRAHREQAIDALKAAFVQGRLTKDELDERVGRALAPLTYAELTALTDDIPAGLAADHRPPRPGLGMTRLRESNAARAGMYATIVAGVAMVASISSGGESPLAVLGMVLLLSPVWALALASLLWLHSRVDKRATRRLPPGRPDCAGPGSTR